MKISKSTIKYGIALLLFVSSSSCTKFLQEDVYTEYDPKVFLQTEGGINSLLNAAYAPLETPTNDMYFLEEFPGDIMWQFGGAAANVATLYMFYNWDPQEGKLKSLWRNYYVSIRNANSLLDNIDNVRSISPEKVNIFKAEAKFIRAVSYYYLWLDFGSVPLITTTDTLGLDPSKPTQGVFDSFITKELKNAADNLPVIQSVYGKATKGAALSFLGEYYLNTHQWQQAADINKEVIDLKQYDLFEGDVKNMFAVENEENVEVIFSKIALPTLHGNPYMSSAFPPGYPIQSNWINYGSQFCIYNDWVKTYNSSDKRLQWFVFNYTDINGQYHDLLNSNDPGRAVRCFKFVPDPNAISENNGNDVPMIRYAEILLNRSEALNELVGPNQESIDLLNRIRLRAGVSSYQLSDFSSKEDLRESLLTERGWEFVAEGKRRMDLVRNGKLISNATQRGAVNADDFKTLYPIPQDEIDANPNLTQNTGYK